MKLINVESLAELRLVSKLADELGTVANIGLRVNPEVSIQNAHRYIATGAKGHKFGIPIDEVEAVGRIALGLPNVSLRALDMHVGSQLEAFDAYEEGTARLVEVSIALRKSGADLRYLDAGGGLPVPYDGEDEPDLTAYARIVSAGGQHARARAARRAGPLLRRRVRRAADAGALPQGDRATRRT